MVSFTDDPPMNRRQNRRRKNKSPAPFESPAPSQTSITDLPLSILIHILSFLPTFDAIRVAAVAPSWRHLWHSLPAMDFCMIYQSMHFPHRISNREARRKFSDFVTQALRNRPRHFPLQVLKILFNFYRETDEIRPIVDSWIRMTVELGVLYLDLHFIGMGKRNKYEFRFSEIVSSSIVVLKLSGSITFSREQVFLPSIRELHLGPDLRDVGPKIEHLISSCINLEILNLVLGSEIDSIPDLNIVSGSLTHLHISSYGANEPSGVLASRSVDICTPSLESLELDGFCLGMYTIKYVPTSLVEATVGFRASTWWDFASWTSVVSSLSGVERLSIRNINLDGNGVVPYKTYDDVRRLIEETESFRDVSKLRFGAEVFSDTFVFHKLKIFTLTTRYSKADIRSLESFLKRCPQLEILVLVCCGNTQDQLMNDDEIADSLIALQIPRLRDVKMEGYLGTKNELFVVNLLKKYGLVLERVVAFPARVGLILPPPFLL